jgi:hypothetical protein
MIKVELNFKNYEEATLAFAKLAELEQPVDVADVSTTAQPAAEAPKPRGRAPKAADKAPAAEPQTPAAETPPAAPAAETPAEPAKKLSMFERVTGAPPAAEPAAPAAGKELTREDASAALEKVLAKAGMGEATSFINGLGYKSLGAIPSAEYANFVAACDKFVKEYVKA